MSSRALRRLQQEATLIKVSGESSEEGEQPGFSRGAKKRETSVANPFAAVSGRVVSELVPGLCSIKLHLCLSSCLVMLMMRKATVTVTMAVVKMKRLHMIHPRS